MGCGPVCFVCSTRVGLSKITIRTPRAAARSASRALLRALFDAKNPECQDQQARQADGKHDIELAVMGM